MAETHPRAQSFSLPRADLQTVGLLTFYLLLFLAKVVTLQLGHLNPGSQHIPWHQRPAPATLR